MAAAAALKSVDVNFLAKEELEHLLRLTHRILGVVEEKSLTEFATRLANAIGLPAEQKEEGNAGVVDPEATQIVGRKEEEETPTTTGKKRKRRGSSDTATMPASAKKKKLKEEKEEKEEKARKELIEKQKKEMEAIDSFQLEGMGSHHHHHHHRVSAAAAPLSPASVGLLSTSELDPLPPSTQPEATADGCAMVMTPALPVLKQQKTPHSAKQVHFKDPSPTLRGAAAAEEEEAPEEGQPPKKKPVGPAHATVAPAKVMPSNQAAWLKGKMDQLYNVQ